MSGVHLDCRLDLLDDNVGKSQRMFLDGRVPPPPDMPVGDTSLHAALQLVVVEVKSAAYFKSVIAGTRLTAEGVKGGGSSPAKSSRRDGIHGWKCSTPARGSRWKE
jgi:hypothetical protein